MSANLGSVVVAIKAVDEASSVMDKVRASTSLLGSAFQSMGGAIGSVGDVMQGFAAGGVAGATIAAIGEITQGLKWAVGQASESEQAFKNLSTAVERSGTAWSTVEGATRDYLSQLQRTTVYSDEALAGMVERLLTFGMSYDEAMKAAGTALDLAAAKHIDLQSASDLLGKAFMGNTAILKRYGIDVEDVGGKSATFTDIMGKLNEQFGGAAQAQANTYAGIQERLKNATSELGEKVGGMVLPALASMTEAMIPVVDWLGKGVDAVGNWLTEVGKMPEVKGFVEAAQGAFDGLWKAMEDFWGFLAETFGPVLEELGGALKEVFDALAPIGEAFAEVWAAITGGQEGGDWLKDFLKFVAQFIREVVVPAIKAAVPIIKGFAEAFKTAADFALPIIREIKDTVVGFINVLKDTFYGFYQWLVGGSLWDDLWNKAADIARNAGDLLGGIITSMFTVFQGLFRGGMDLISSIITTGFSLTFATVQSIVTGATDVLRGLIKSIQDLIGGVSRDWAGLVTQISTSLDPMKRLITDFWNWLTAFWQAGVNQILTITQSGFAQIQSIMAQLQVIVTTGVTSIQGMFANMVASAQNAAAQVQAAFAQAQQTQQPINTAAQQVAVGTTYIPAGPGAAPSAAEYEASIASLTTATGAPVAPGTTTLISYPEQNITVPVQVQVDGATVAKTVEKRLVQQYEYMGRR